MTALNTYIEARTTPHHTCHPTHGDFAPQARLGDPEMEGGLGKTHSPCPMDKALPQMAKHCYVPSTQQNATQP